MKMKSLLIFLAALILPLNVFAFEVQEKPKITTPEQISSVVKVALNQENSPHDYLATPILNNQTIPQSSTEKPSEFITELSVYLLIIAIYSIYGFRASSKNIRD